VHLIENLPLAPLEVGGKNVIARFPGRVLVDSHRDLGIDLDLSQPCFDKATGLRIG
jgi:hypothetical protein